MNEVTIIIGEGLYPNLLAEALVKNPKCKVVRIVKNGNIVGNKTVIGSLAYLVKKASPIFLLAKFFEVILFYYASAFIPQDKRAFKTLKELSSAYGIPVEVSFDINKFFNSADGLSDQILFSMSYYQKVHKKTLALFKDTYNIHPAPLPEGAGLFASFWQMIFPAENNRCYQTIHRMTDKIDDGMIVAQGWEEKPKNRKSSADYMYIATRIGCRLLGELDFSGLDTDREAEHYISGRRSYHSYPGTKDVLLFLRKGNVFFHFSDIKRLLYKSKDQIRAFQLEAP